MIRPKFQCRSWPIRHLKQAGIPQADLGLAIIFATTIRPVIRVRHTGFSLYDERNAVGRTTVEKMQRRMFKIIFGHRTSYRKALEQCGGLPTLAERRDEIFKKIAEKTSQNPNFSHWFPQKRRMPLWPQAPRQVPIKNCMQTLIDYIKAPCSRSGGI